MVFSFMDVYQIPKYYERPDYSENLSFPCAVKPHKNWGSFDKSNRPHFLLDDRPNNPLN